jgi:hypothetical protein
MISFILNGVNIFIENWVNKGTPLPPFNNLNVTKKL